VSLVVLHAPLHAPSAKERPAEVLAAIRKQRPTMVGLTEAYGILDELRSLRAYRLVVEDGGSDRRRGQRDNPVLVRRSLRSVGSGQVFGSGASTPLRIAPERWITWSAVRVPDHDVVCHISLHPHAAIQDKATGRLNISIDRGRKAQQQFDALDRLLDYVKTNGWTPVVTGDLNFRDRDVTGPSPYRVLREHGLEVHSHGLDVLAAHKRLGLSVDVVIAPTSITDHPWLRGVAA
jgi:hypothetical protein